MTLAAPAFTATSLIGGAMLATARRHSTIGYLSAVEFERKAGLA